MEKWDLLDENRQPLNKTHIRGEEMLPGEYHVAVGIWTVNSKNEVLLTLRHPDKEDYPDVWENTGGCIQSGETSRQGAVRELVEETGIQVEEDELIFLGTERGHNAFMDAYMVIKDVPLSELAMQDGETVEARWVSFEELDNMIASGQFASALVGRLIQIRPELERNLKEPLFRKAQKGDEAGILEVIKVALGEYGLNIEPEGADQDVTDLEMHYLSNGGWFQVITHQGCVIGSVGVYKIDQERCELRKMYLYPEYQGKQIGKQLMENSLKAAKDLGFKRMLLQTNSKLAKALPIYEKYGFKNDESGEVCSRCDIAMIREL